MVNSKRVDFALIDGACRVVHALEYQGTGHHAGLSAAARDAVKKEALRKAGIGYHEVVAGHTTPSELRALVEKLVPGHNSRIGSSAAQIVFSKLAANGLVSLTMVGPRRIYTDREVVGACPARLSEGTS